MALQLNDIEHIPAMLRLQEELADYRVVWPGDVPWFPVADWIGESCVVSIGPGRRVRLLMLLARKPGGGAFRRMIAGLQAEALVPVVVEPSPRLQRLLESWKWRSRRTSRGTIWYPRTKE